MVFLMGRKGKQNSRTRNIDNKYKLGLRLKNVLVTILILNGHSISIGGVTMG